LSIRGFEEKALELEVEKVKMSLSTLLNAVIKAASSPLNLGAEK